MSALVIRWQGLARRRAISAVLQDRLQAWLRDWSVNPVAAQIEDLPREHIQATCWQTAIAPQGACVMAGLDAACIGRLGSMLAAAPARLAGDVKRAQAVGRDAVQALAGSIVTDVGAVTETRNMPAAALSERHGWCSFEVSLGDIRFALLVDPKACEQLDPIPSSVPVLEPRSKALKQTDITLNATLALGSVDISLVSALRPGDILGTDIALSTPLTLGVAGGGVVLAGRLVVLDQHKAISVDLIH